MLCLGDGEAVARDDDDLSGVRHLDRRVGGRGRLDGALLATGTGTAGSAATGVLSVQGIASMTPILATVTNAGTFAAQAAPTASATGGSTTCYLTSAASTNATVCKASAGQVYAVRAVNTTTTNYFLRMYNLASGPTCSSATGFVETIPVLGAATNGGGIATPNGAVGQAYGTGIAFCLTGGGGSTDNTNAATGVYLTILYQ